MVEHEHLSHPVNLCRQRRVLTDGCQGPGELGDDGRGALVIDLEEEVVESLKL